MQMNEHSGVLPLFFFLNTLFNISVLEEAHGHMIIVYSNCNFTVQPFTAHGF